MVKRGFITFIFCFHCAFGTYPSGEGGETLPVSSGEQLHTQIQKLRDDFALALLVVAHPHAVGLEHFKVPRPLGDLSAQVSALGSSIEELVLTHSDIDLEINLLTSYYDLLSKLLHLDYLENGGAKGLDLQAYYIAIDAQTLSDWGGEGVPQELNSNPQSIYRLATYEKGHLLEFKERFLLELQLHKISKQDEEDKLLALTKILASEVLVDGLAMASTFAGEEVQKYHLDPSIQRILHEKMESIERERTLQALISSKEISAILLSKPLVDTQLILDILHGALPDEEFFAESESLAELIADINWEHPRVLNYIVDEAKSLEDFVSATERGRKKLLSEVMFNILANSEGVEFDQEMVSRYQQVIENHNHDEQWLQGLGPQLQNSPQWGQTLRLREGLLQLARDLVRSVRKSRGELELVGGHKEQMALVAQLARQQLKPKQLATAIVLTLEEIEAAKDFEQAKTPAGGRPVVQGSSKSKELVKYHGPVDRVRTEKIFQGWLRNKWEQYQTFALGLGLSSGAGLLWGGGKAIHHKLAERKLSAQKLLDWANRYVALRHSFIACQNYLNARELRRQMDEATGALPLPETTLKERQDILGAWQEQLQQMNSELQELNALAPELQEGVLVNLGDSQNFIADSIGDQLWRPTDRQSCGLKSDRFILSTAPIFKHLQQTQEVLTPLYQRYLPSEELP